jgi:2,4-dienoyl-CoA reductase (NADPH2)
MPDVAERILAAGEADMVSMARPLLADPQWVEKARTRRVDEINTCIACNQACLDHVFQNKTASCLVNPRAVRKPSSCMRRPRRRRKSPWSAPARPGWPRLPSRPNAAIASPCSMLPAKSVASSTLPSGFPARRRFFETLRYFRRKLELTKVEVRLNTRADATTLATSFDEVVLASGIRPRAVDFPGSTHPKVLSYIDVLTGRVVPGAKVAIVGAGGIGFDMAEFLVHEGRALDAGMPALDAQRWRAEWGVDIAYEGNRVRSARGRP